jgi:hypothetical protein
VVAVAAESFESAGVSDAARAAVEVRVRKERRFMGRRVLK